MENSINKFKKNGYIVSQDETGLTVILNHSGNVIAVIHNVKYLEDLLESYPSDSLKEILRIVKNTPNISSDSFIVRENTNYIDNNKMIVKNSIEECLQHLIENNPYLDIK